MRPWRGRMWCLSWTGGMAVLGPHLYDGVPLSVAPRQAEVPLRTARSDGWPRIGPTAPRG